MQGMHYLRTLLGMGMFLLAISAASAAEPASRGALVLVPGTLNHLIPGSLQVDIPEGEIEAYPYFSGTIVSTVQSLGYSVYVVKDLSALGSMESNGETVVSEVRAWYSSSFPHGGVPLTLLGHSAGGFYALYAASHLTDLPVAKVLTLSTPFSGADLANISSGLFDLQGTSQEIYKTTFGVIDLRGLPELTSSRVRGFLAALSVQPSLTIRSYGCTQKAMPIPFLMQDAKYLWPGFYGTAAAIGGAADGIVGLSSVYGDGVTIKTTASGGKGLAIQAERGVTCNLDHPEQALDYRIFSLFGQTDIGYVASEQKRFYTAILSQN